MDSPAWTSIAAILCLCASFTRASPLEARAPATVYEYMKATTIPMPAATIAASCPNATVTETDACPVGCTAAPLAGMLGIVTSKFSCVVPKPATSYTSYMATSTCESGSVVTTYSLWDGDRPLGCHATY